MCNLRGGTAGTDFVGDCALDLNWCPRLYCHWRAAFSGSGVAYWQQALNFASTSPLVKRQSVWAPHSLSEQRHQRSHHLAKNGRPIACGRLPKHEKHSLVLSRGTTASSEDQKPLLPLTAPSQNAQTWQEGQCIMAGSCISCEVRTI